MSVDAGGGKHFKWPKTIKKVNRQPAHQFFQFKKILGLTGEATYTYINIPQHVVF